LNGKPVGSHAGGRTTFTLDVTGAIKTDGTKNELEVDALHPANIKDLPWFVVVVVTKGVFPKARNQWDFQTCSFSCYK
jgi:hypothetical protein